MKLKRLVPGIIGSNCYILFAENGQAAVIDPGAPGAEIMKAIRAENAELRYILLTHGHFDHMLGLDRLRAENPQAQLLIHADDAELMSDGHKNAFFDIFGKDRDFGSPDQLLIQGDIIELGREKISVLHTPGHTKGSVCYRVGRVMFTGDTIMADSYGRCDLYSGDIHKMNYIISRLTSLQNREGNLMIYPGHGDSSTLENALRNIYNG